MKFGGKSPAVRIGVTALFAVSVLWFGYTMWVMFGGAEAAPAPAAPAATAAPKPKPRAPGEKGGTLITLEKRLDPTLRLELLKAAEETVYKGSGRNIFRPYEEPVRIPDPVAPPTTPNGTDEIVDTGPPPPPPINLKFYGFASRPGEPKKVFLAQGENIFIGGEGDIVNRRYRIVRIGPNSVEIEDVLDNRRQSIPLTSS